MKKIILLSLAFLAILLIQSCTQSNVQSPSQAAIDQKKVHLPDLKMPTNGLAFKQIEGYEQYKIVATHFRKDKNELRYILANETEFDAYKTNTTLPDGSIVVKIGWDTEDMSNFGAALEAKKVQRVEYMIKNKKSFSKNPGNWGYARFVKDGKTKSLSSSLMPNKSTNCKKC